MAISSKTMDESPQPKKAKPSGVKRPLEPTKDHKDKEKKKKTSVSEVDHASAHAEDEPGEDQKKLFQRVWTEEDEIGLLNGFLDFTKMDGNLGDEKAVFLEFLKKYLHAVFNKTQLLDKLRRLKKKYQTIVRKGKEPAFKSDHERAAYAISEKIWGGKIEDDGDTTINQDSMEAKGGSNSKRSLRVRSSATKDSKTSDSVSAAAAADGKNQAKKPQKSKEMVMVDNHKNSTNVASRRDLKNRVLPYPCLNESLHYCTNSVSPLSPGWQPVGRNRVCPPLKLLEKGVALLENSEAEQLEEKWQKLQMMALDVRAKRIELIEELSRLILEAMKSSNS